MFLFQFIYFSIKATVRRESASGIARLLGEEVNLNVSEYKKLVEGLVRRLRDVDESLTHLPKYSELPYLPFEMIASITT